MGFILNANRTFSAPCRSADGQTFDVTFRALTDEQVKEHDFDSVEGEKTFLRAIVHDIPDIEGDDKQPIAFGPEVLGQMLEFADLRGAFLRGYREQVTGAQTGN
ncbi:MAG: hypothetical protein ACRBB0_25670 [Pelagimonas sp.]|uniref:hypothetical protein n=1 Tax=Pelagimonas sp. TaxID=2073170 RepID=UPI003D6B512C